MPGKAQATETEVKVFIESIAAFRRKLGEAGFRVKRRRVFERNTIFESDPPSLRPKGCLLRLREAGKRVTVTFKGKAIVGKYKSREEIEFQVSDVNAANMVFTRLGYKPGFVYEKYRSEFFLAGSAGVVTLDETPIGIYAELEGEEKWIDKSARMLGVDDKQYITSSYGTLYAEWCRRENVIPGNMEFR